jgi:hypothetical protein
VLPPETESVWGFLRAQPALAGFVLVGGSALALRIGHRLSEDLDLVWPEARLPRARLEAFRRAAAAAGFDFQPSEDEVAANQFLDSGLDLHDYHQDYIVNRKVKVSFFAAEPPLQRVLQARPEAGVRIASLSELFKTKCLVSAQRSKTRDWIDLYLLFRDHGFTLRDYRAAFAEAGVASQCDIGLSRLCSGVPQKDDEGYAHLLPNPPGLVEMKEFFTARRDQDEIDLAAETLRRRQPEGGRD